MNSQNSIFKSLTGPALLTALLLTIPLIASQFTNDVDWSTGDYILAAILLFGTGFIYKLITGKTGTFIYRAGVGIALASSLFLVWVNLAVGLVGSEDNLFNLVYFGVPFIGIISAITFGFQSQGLERTMFIMAFVQTLATVTALGTGMHELPNSSITEILAVNGLFIVLFTVSALLFRYDEQNNSREQAPKQV